MTVGETTALSDKWKNLRYGDDLSEGARSWIRFGHFYYTFKAAEFAAYAPEVGDYTFNEWYEMVP